MSSDLSMLNAIQPSDFKYREKMSYTPRTFGEKAEQLEFDFGLEFSKLENETKVETNPQDMTLASLIGEVVSLKTGSANHEG